MAEAIVVPLLIKLQEVVVKEAKALAEVGGHIEKLRDKLLWLHALAHEADLHSRHDGSRLVQVLAFQIRDAGFDVEDAVDHFFLKGSLSRRFGRYSWWRISKELILHFGTHVYVRGILSSRIRSINVRLEEIIGNNSTYTLSKSGSGDGKTWRASRAIPPMRTDWDTDYSMEFVLKYRRIEREELMGKINKENLPKVITVAGVEGVGKTALLMHAYKSNKKVFIVRIWLSFPADIDHESMFQQIKEELGNKAKAKGEDPRKVRCLVVIGSPVRTTTWRKVEGRLLEMVGKDSKIVLSVTLSWREERTKQDTTNKHGPMNPDDSKEETNVTIQLHPMDDYHSTKLFNLIYGFKRDERKNYQVAEMNHIRSYIMEITDGVPLAVVLVARLMRTVDFGKWKAAADYLKCNSEDSKLKTILSVCVDDLSDELKSCLFYTAGFPENRPIDADQLVRLWMAEGFLARQHKLETELLGQCYLKELIYRGLLHLKRRAPGGNVLSVAIPYQIHPLLRSEAQRTSFMDVHYGGSLPPSGNTRRLALHNYNDKFPALENCLEKLRTVISYSHGYTDYPNGHKQEKSSKDAHELEQSSKDAHELEQSSKDAHELEQPSKDAHELEQSSKDAHELEQSSKDAHELEQSSKDAQQSSKDAHELEQSSKDEPELHPNTESEPKPKLFMREFLQRSPYLRVINLEGIQVVKKKKDQMCALPRAIGDMVHLQYLGIRCRGLTKVPSSIGKLRSLQTIDVRGTEVRSLPESLWKVKTLRHVFGDNLAFPRSSSTSIGDDLKLMHTLESVTIDHQDDDSCRCTTAAPWKRRKLELLRFPFLHRLHVAELKESQVNALASILKDLSSLEALILSGEHIPMDLFANAWKATASWMKRMEFLKLDGPLHLQDASNKLVDYQCLENVTHLVLQSTKIGQEFINCIGMLPDLAELELLEGSYEGKELTINTGAFSSLTMLRISGLQALEKISVPDATARRNRNMAIKMDVPDNVDVPDEPQQQIAETAASDQQGTTTTPSGGNSGRLLEGKNDNKDIFTEIILDAAHSNNSSITSITNYIKDMYVAVCLENMVKSQILTEGKANNGRPKYVLGEKDGSPLPDKKHRIITEMILEAVNKNNSSKTNITNYINNTYVVTHLDFMVQQGFLRKERAKNRYDKYVLPDNMVQERILTEKKAKSGTTSSSPTPKV